jgi:hypothetical protein
MVCTVFPCSARLSSACATRLTAPATVPRSESKRFQGTHPQKNFQTQATKKGSMVDRLSLTGELLTSGGQLIQEAGTLLGYGESHTNLSRVWATVYTDARLIIRSENNNNRMRWCKILPCKYRCCQCETPQIRPKLLIFRDFVLSKGHPHKEEDEN